MGTEKWIGSSILYFVIRVMAYEKITSFTKLVAWQEGHKLVLMVYRATDHFPSKEQFILIAQMLRAVISVTSNLAEGFSRSGRLEKKQFYFTSKASLTELQNQLLIAKDVGYLNKESFNSIAQQTVVVHKLINGLIKSATTKP